MSLSGSTTWSCYFGALPMSKRNPQAIRDAAGAGQLLEQVTKTRPTFRRSKGTQGCLANRGLHALHMVRPGKLISARLIPMSVRKAFSIAAKVQVLRTQAR